MCPPRVIVTGCSSCPSGERTRFLAALESEALTAVGVFAVVDVVVVVVVVLW